MNPIQWCRALNNCVRNFSSEVRRLSALENEFRDRTEIHADIAWHSKADSCIIIAGRYKNRDYVRTFSVTSDCLADLVEDLIRWEKQYGHVKTLDAPPLFKAVFERERNR